MSDVKKICDRGTRKCSPLSGLQKMPEGREGISAAPKVDSQMEVKELPVNCFSKGMTRGGNSDNGRDLLSIGYWEGFRKEGFSGECQP